MVQNPTGDDAERRSRVFEQLDLLRERADIQSVEIDRIRPGFAQPRELMDETGIEDLAASIERNGLLQAILVRPTRGGELELIAGERRWRAARLLGWPTIPARVLHHVDDTTAAILGLVENVDREGLTAWEEAQAVAALRGRLLAAGRPAGGAELARLFGWSEAKVSERLTIADGLPADVLAQAGFELHAVKKLPKSLLLNVARVVGSVEKLRALAAALRAAPRQRPTIARPRAGRPRAGFSFRTPKSGRVSLQLRRPVAELPAEEARTLLARLEPVLAELRQRAEGHDPETDAEA
jgi:ParB/RepB/Spo0J family partition protein